MEKTSDRAEHIAQYYQKKFEALTNSKKFCEDKNLSGEALERFLYRFYSGFVDLAIASFSLGNPIEKTIGHVEEALHWLLKRGDNFGAFESVEGTYKPLVLVSLVRLLDLEEKHLPSLQDWYTKLDRTSKPFELILYGKPIDDSAYQEAKVESVYSGLFTIFEATNRELAIEALQTYLSKWYSNHKSCYWWGSHKEKQPNYFGYWSFEAAAVAKIKGLDLSASKLGEYFPYSFFDMDDQFKPKRQPEKQDAIQSETRVSYPNFAPFSVDTFNDWINESAERLSLVTKDEQLECAGTIYRSSGQSFDEFISTRLEALISKMPWYKKVGSSVRRKLPIGEADEQMLQGIWQGENEPTSYLVYALKFGEYYFGEYYMGLTFTYMTGQENIYRPKAEKLMQSLIFQSE